MRVRGLGEEGVKEEREGGGEWCGRKDEGRVEEERGEERGT